MQRIRINERYILIDNKLVDLHAPESRLISIALDGYKEEHRVLRTFLIVLVYFSAFALMCVFTDAVMGDHTPGSHTSLLTIVLSTLVAIAEIGLATSPVGPIVAVVLTGYFFGYLYSLWS